MATADQRVVAPTRWILTAATTKPSEGSGLQVPPGSTVYEYDTGNTFVTHDRGVNWVIKGDVVPGKMKTITGTSSAISTGAYAVNEMVCDSTATGTMTAFAAVARENGGSGYITNAHLSLGTTLLSPRITALIFNVGTVVGGTIRDGVVNDNVQGTDQDGYIGAIDFMSLETLGTGGDSEALVTPSTVGGLPLGFTCASGADDLYALLVTRDAVTAGTNLTTRIDLTVEQY
ncbi:hypothetical protein LCGC14_0349720 [marine sediment metagenome]|uniref:Uncharacterized protein n=1 Tax=marine sediment metagenome TaxID=412755 RepID=A0A0F9TB37_9ZZZZ